MNKLIFITLISLMILYVQSAECDAITDESKCGEAENPPDGKVCQYDTNQSKCALVDAPAGSKPSTNSDTKSDTKSSSKTTNSSEILNIFKITFALLIIFTIL